MPPPVRSERGFLRQVTVATALGEGLDGYDLGAISVVLPTITAQLSLTSVLNGLVGATSLIGIFIGAPLFGFLTDRFGRRRVFILDLIAFVILGVLQLVATDAAGLIAVRLLLGVAIGAEYAVGPAMLAELSPTRGRGGRLSYLQACWYIGFVVSVALAYVLTDLGLTWQQVLATSAVPAAITLVLRYGLPESPRWLLSRGRPTEARAIVDRYLGGDAYYESEELADEPARPGQFAELFAPAMRTRTAFACIFWACIVAPYFAIFTFAPKVFDSLGIVDVRAVTISENAIAAVGAIVGVFLVDRVGRRPMLLVGFWVTAVMLAIVGAWTHAPGVVVIVCFAGFSMFNAAQGNLTGVYPSELFPSDLRSSGVGLAAASSRIGAAGGTFLLPIGFSSIGVGPSVLIGAAICVLGAAVTHAWAPETTGRSLTRTSATGNETHTGGGPRRGTPVTHPGT